MGEPDCVLCQIVAGELPARFLYTDATVVSFLDIAPATRGHALVVPRRHSTDLFDIADDDLQHTVIAARRLARRIDETLEPDGFNLLNSCRPAAWQTVFHFHIHVIPRYEGDPLKLPWIPRGGDADEIAATAEKIRQ